MTRANGQLAALLLLSAASGAAALIYEIVWFQLLELVIGSTAAALGVLLATFMGGMCLGSLLLPRIQTRKHPLRVYAAIEMFRQSLFDALADTVGERRSDLDLLARNPNLHESHVYGIPARFRPRAAVSRTLPKKSGGP